MKKYIILLTICIISEIALALYLTEWRHTFWDIIERKELHPFLEQLGIFTGVACLICFISGWDTYLASLIAIEWRKKLNAKAIKIKGGHIENLSQRVQEDCREYPRLMVDVVFNIGRALLYIVVFIGSFIYNYNWIYLVILFIYAFFATGLAKKVAAPLIKYNYEIQKQEATYRQHLIKPNFDGCISLMFGIALREKYLAYFQSFYNQVGVVLPIILMAPEYFLTSLTLGGLMMGTSILGTILDNLSYGINAFGEINLLLSSKRRLKEIGVV